VNDRTRVYIDGFNLFYGCLKGTRHRWINLEALCRQELPNNYIAAVRYFTAPVIPRPHKPHEAQNQQMYLRALATLPRVTIHLGHFLEKRTRGYLIDPQTDKPTQQMVRIQVPEEKGTDVNIATYLLLDGTQEMYDVAVIISNDTDLEEPIRAVRERLGLAVGVLSPFTRVSWPLKNAATFYRPIRRQLLANCDLPHTLTDAQGTITRPQGW